MYKKILIFCFFCLMINCSEFNNPVKPTYVIACSYYNNSYKVEISSTNILLYCGTSLYKDAEIKNTIAAFYIKTNADMSKDYSALNTKNSNYVYKVVLDSLYDIIGIDSSIITVHRCMVTLQSSTGTCYDTSYYNYYDKYEIIFNLNNELMNYPVQFLWQAQLFNASETDSEVILLPPKPYVYCRDN